MKTETKQEHYNFRTKHGLCTFRLTLKPSYLPFIKANIEALINQDKEINKEVRKYLKRQLKELKK